MAGALSDGIAHAHRGLPAAPNAWLVRLTCAEMAACLGPWRRSREDTARAMVVPLRQGKLSHEGFDPPAGFAQDTEPFPAWG